MNKDINIIKLEDNLNQKNFRKGEDMLFNNSNGSQPYKEWIETLWSSFSEYAPSDFIEHFQKDPNKIEASVWEMLLANRLLESNFKLIKARSSDCPDICIEDINSNKKVWFECSIPSKGDPEKKDSVIERDFTQEEAHKIDYNPHILRCTNTIDAKIAQYQKWLKKGICKENEPFIIAINGLHLELGIYKDKLPDIMRAVYPVGDPYMAFSKGSPGVESGYFTQPEIVKKSGALVNKCYFNDPKYSFITGILFSNNWWGKSSNMPLYTYLPNVYAKAPITLDLSEFSQICIAKLVGDKIELSLKTYPWIISRLALEGFIRGLRKFFLLKRWSKP